MHATENVNKLHVLVVLVKKLVIFASGGYAVKQISSANLLFETNSFLWNTWIFYGVTSRMSALKERLQMLVSEWKSNFPQVSSFPYLHTAQIYQMLYKL